MVIWPGCKDFLRRSSETESPALKNVEVSEEKSRESTILNTPLSVTDYKSMMVVMDLKVVVS